MNRFRNKFFLTCFPIVFLTILSGCASLPHSKSSGYADAPSTEMFLSPAPNFNSEKFLSRWSRELTEHDKIRYLLERVSSSTNRFIRNGEFHNGKIARQWLLYKMGHWVRGVETADDFVRRVASYSQKTGQPYLVELSEDHNLYSLRSILHNELAAFEEHRSSLPPQPQTVMLPKAVQVSLPPVLATRTSE